MPFVNSFDQLSTEDQARGIRLLSNRAIRFSALDMCANLAREHGLWKQCASTIHERNMSMLGKTRQGYAPAVWKKGFHEVTVTNERGTVAGKRVHVRQLCKRGYKYVPRERK